MLANSTAKPPSRSAASSVVRIYRYAVFLKWGYPKNGRFIEGNPIKMDDLGVPLFQETSICPNETQDLKSIELKFNCLGVLYPNFGTFLDTFLRWPYLICQCIGSLGVPSHSSKLLSWVQSPTM